VSLIAAALWGFAEATLFFLVPDVLLTGIAMRKGLRVALLASLAAAAAATAGGLIMYRWAAADAAGARQVIDLLPAVSPAQIGRCGRLWPIMVSRRSLPEASPACPTRFTPSRRELPPFR
jgi:hypothetical protein